MFVSIQCFVLWVRPVQPREDKTLVLGLGSIRPQSVLLFAVATSGPWWLVSARAALRKIVPSSILVPGRHGNCKQISIKR